MCDLCVQCLYSFCSSFEACPLTNNHLELILTIHKIFRQLTNLESIHPRINLFTYLLLAQLANAIVIGQ